MRRAPRLALWSTRAVLLTLLVAVAPDGRAQQPPPIQIDIVGRGSSVISIAIPSGGSGAHADEFIQVLRDDLEFTGNFNIVDPSLYRLVPQAPFDRPVGEDWVKIGAEALLATRFDARGGRLDVEARLFDAKGGAALFGRRYGGSTDIVRRTAHQLADDIVQHYTGRKGIASTRMAFVSEHGAGKEIYLMDYDGARVRRLTSNGVLNLSPAWSPDGNELAFLSWRGKQPSVYVMSAEGRLGSLAVLGGELTTSPDWSPDGRQVAYTSSAAGNTEIYVLDRRTGKNRRVTHNAAIDTAPAFSPNGREIAFTSDRGGTPQIYLMDIEGLNTRRMSHDGSYCDSAAWSPDGTQLAYASRQEGRFEIVLLDLASNETRRLTRGQGNNENPRWSPDGRHLVFASSRSGSYQIWTMRADGTHSRQLTRGAASYTPDWSR